ncbi:hypothetical protein RHM66_15390 [Pseudomonas sp. RTB3]|nr:hypothetical protein RHM66_15390 [Pseudomonas sp. RTB3]
MRDVMRWKHAALLALAILAAGCSSNSKKELPPAELTDFKEEVVLQKQWSRSIGDGQGKNLQHVGAGNRRRKHCGR